MGRMEVSPKRSLVLLAMAHAVNHAFADLLTRPWGNAKLFWFDGGYRNPNQQETEGLIEKELLAVMQISLRPAPDRRLSLRDVEAALIRKAVAEAHGNVMEAARVLGISRATVYRKLGRR